MEAVEEAVTAQKGSLRVGRSSARNVPGWCSSRAAFPCQGRKGIARAIAQMIGLVHLAARDLIHLAALARVTIDLRPHGQMGMIIGAVDAQMCNSFLAFCCNEGYRA